MNTISTFFNRYSGSLWKICGQNFYLWFFELKLSSIVSQNPAKFPISTLPINSFLWRVWDPFGSHDLKWLEKHPYNSWILLWQKWLSHTRNCVYKVLQDVSFWGCWWSFTSCQIKFVLQLTCLETKSNTRQESHLQEAVSFWLSHWLALQWTYSLAISLFYL